MTVNPTAAAGVPMSAVKRPLAADGDASAQQEGIELKKPKLEEEEHVSN